MGKIIKLFLNKLLSMKNFDIALFLSIFYTKKMNENLYFDTAATEIFDEAVLKNALEKSFIFSANPSSLHDKGKEAKRCLDSCREKAAKALGIKEKELYFTSGGTEANQIALLSLLTRPRKGTILISAIEHPAIREQAKMLEQLGWPLDIIPVDNNGFIKLDAFKAKLNKDIALVSVMAVNNETGAIQPIEELGTILDEVYSNMKKPRFHIDAVQAIGKIPFSLSHSAIDSAAISAHKIGGPRGIGALYSKKPIESFLKGGGQERAVRSGTENIFGIYAFAEVLSSQSMISNQNEVSNSKEPISTKAFLRYEEQKKLISFFIQKFLEIPGAQIIPTSRLGNEEEKFSPWIVQASIKNLPAQVLIRALSAKKIYISSGSACSSQTLSRPVLEAMNIPKNIMQNAVRFSFSPKHKKTDIELLIKTLEEVVTVFC